MPLSWVSHGFDAQNATAPFITDGPMVPLPGTLKGFSPKARGYAVCGVTPGMGGRCATTPKAVVPGNRTGALTRRGYGVVMQINWALCPFGRTEAPTVPNDAAARYFSLGTSAMSRSFTSATIIVAGRNSGPGHSQGHLVVHSR